jgi:NAD(P)H-hydrate repair Nnr-like enzyme with NAD(P)H-hydrate epimerase domain
VETGAPVVVRTCGQPVEDPGRRTEEVSAAHPATGQRYRDARAVKEATEHGPVDTEQQRHAVTSYRALVDALLGRSTEREEHTR